MKARKTLAAILTLLCLPIVLYAPFLLGGKVLYWGVYILQFHPWRTLAVEQIRAGLWPLWNPYLGAGTPLAANLQTAAFYPPNVIFLLMPVEQAFGWGLALHIALAGLSAYFLGRTLGMNRFGALVGALTYAGGGYLVARWVFPSMVYAAAWLPLMLALVEKVVGTRAGVQSQIRAALALALVTALQLLAGHAQTSFYSLLIVAAFALYRLLQKRDLGDSRRLRTTLLAAGSLLLAVLGGVALAAIQLLPTAELAAQSQRAGRLTDLQFAYELSFWPWRLITLLAPDFFGNPARGEYWAYGTYWEEAAYVGILPLLLAALALAAWWQNRGGKDSGRLRLVPFIALLSILSLVLALGKHTPLYPLLFEYVLGFGLFQAPARLMIGHAIGIAVLAGIGADTLRITPRTRTVLRVLLLVGLGMGVAGFVVRLALPAVEPSFGNSTARLGLTLALACSLLLLRGHKLRGGAWQAAVVVLVLIDLLGFGWGLAPGADPTVYRNPVATTEFLASQSAGRILVAPGHAQEMYDAHVSLSTFGPSDPAYLQDLRESQLPNLNAAQRLSGTGNYDPLAIGLYRDLWDQVEEEGDSHPAFEQIQRIADLFGARYIISDTSPSIPLPAIYASGPVILHNDSSLPEAYFVTQARVVEDPEARLEILRDPGFDPHAEVVLSQTPKDPLPLQSTTLGNAPPPVPVVNRKGPNQVEVQIDTPQPGYLVLADTYYPGWRATIDGQEREILPANHAFRAVRVEPGERTVVFDYDPIFFRAGAWITLLAALLLATLLIANQVYRRAS